MFEKTTFGTSKIQVLCAAGAAWRDNIKGYGQKRGGGISKSRMEERC
jgi:hypothetical protein